MISLILALKYQCKVHTKAIHKTTQHIVTYKIITSLLHQYYTITSTLLHNYLNITTQLNTFFVSYLFFPILVSK